MTQNEVKKALSAASDAYYRYKAKYDEMNAFADQLAIKPMLYTGSGGGKATKANGTEAGYVALAALEDRVCELYLQWLSARDRVSDMIAECDDCKAAAVLTYRYLNGKSFEETALFMGISVQHMFRLHKKGLQSLVKKYAENESK